VDPDTQTDTDLDPEMPWDEVDELDRWAFDFTSEESE
jgi:hypothetical protein